MLQPGDEIEYGMSPRIGMPGYSSIGAHVVIRRKVHDGDVPAQLAALQRDVEDLWMKAATREAEAIMATAEAVEKIDDPSQLLQVLHAHFQRETSSEAHPPAAQGKPAGIRRRIG